MISELARASSEYDPSEGTPVPCLTLDEGTLLLSMPVMQILELVPSPVAAEDPARIAEDPVLAAYAEIRNQVQRAMEGAKARNATAYGKYLAEWMRDERPGVVPPITLYSPERLRVVKFGNATSVVIPYGAKLPAIDGETQRVGWERAAKEVGIGPLRRRIAVVLHHGKTIDQARQAFYDLNVLEVKPSAAIAISMDTLDPGTRITRTLIQTSPVLRDKVNVRRRQLRKQDAELMTISALRTAVITTLLGRPGLQYGTRSIDLRPELVNSAEQAVVRVWTEILDEFAEEVADRNAFLITAPAVLAGLGCVAHHAMPEPPRGPDVEAWSIDRILKTLRSVRWDRDPAIWNGIVGKLTPRGNFSIAGPKEVGHAVADALEQPESDAGKQLRGEGLGQSESRPQASIGGELQEAAARILASHGSPMHVTAIREALIAQGMQIPGKGTDANVTVHLRRAPELFESRGRGQYTLAASATRKRTT